jgi:hypothetical protein
MARRPHAFPTLLVGVLAACTQIAESRPSLPEPWPIDPEAVADPDRMVVEPAAAAAGEIVELTFPGGHDRGILFAIDASVGGGWERSALLISDASGANPTWFRGGDDDIAVDAIGIGGDGPDRVPIPHGLLPGDYRICTANAGENLCVPIQVVAP